MTVLEQSAHILVRPAFIIYRLYRFIDRRCDIKQRTVITIFITYTIVAIGAISATRKRQTGMQKIGCADISTDLYAKFVADRRSRVLRSRNPRQVVHRHRTRIIALYARLRRSRRLSIVIQYFFPSLPLLKLNVLTTDTRVIKCLCVTVNRRVMHLISHRYDNCKMWGNMRV